MRKSIGILLGLTAALALAGLGGAAWLRSRAEQAVVEVRGVAVTRGPLQAFVKATAFVEARRELTVAAPVSGRLAMQAVDVGQAVRRGQVLARFDPADSDEHVHAAEAALRAVELQVQQAERNHRAEQAVWEAGGQTRQAVEEARSALQIQQSHRDRARAELGAARVQRGQLTVSAPADGLVTSVEVREGEFVPMGAALLHVATLDELEVRLKVDQGVADLVQTQQAVELIAESSVAVVGRSRITRIDPKIQKDGSTYYLVAWAPLRGSGLSARPNQQFTARILTTSRDDALRVPLDLLTERDGAEAVRVIDNGRLRLQPVKTGIQDGRHVEILDGVAEHQTVVQGNARQQLKEGMAVRLATPASAPAPAP